MRLNLAFDLDGVCGSELRDLGLPFEFDLGPLGRHVVEPWEESVAVGLYGEGDRVLLRSECPVEIAGMRLERDVLRGTDAVDCPEVDGLIEGAERVSGALGYWAGRRVDRHPLLGHAAAANRFLADTARDTELLARLGDRVALPLLGLGAVELFDRGDLDAESLQALAERPHVLLYAEVLHAGSPQAKVNALWRTLEMAFQAKNTRLSRLIGEFPPAVALGFDFAELEALRALRGRLGHAESKAGGAELRRGRDLGVAHMGRL